MPVSYENEWTFIDSTSTTTQAQDMASINETTVAPAAEPKIELTINPKPTTTDASIDKKEVPACTCDASMPRLERQDSIESFISVDDDYRRPPRRLQQNYIRNYSPSRAGRHGPNYSPVALLGKSEYLLTHVNVYDGIIDLPRPSRGATYLTTFPFTEKDVKKWSWLFSLKVEDTFLEKSSSGRDLRADDDDDVTIRRARVNMAIYDATTIDLPSIYLSRALDTEVVPEDAANVSFLIVTHNRHHPAGSKLLVAESRKAASIMMYYEALKGDSTIFVGAAVDFGSRKVHPKKFRKVESLEEATKAQDEGFMGIIC